MNKFNTIANGGLPFVLDDLRFEQAAVRDAFGGLLSAFGISPGDPFIISGVILTGGFIPGSTFTEGYINLNGEILKVESGVLPPNPNGPLSPLAFIYVFREDTTYDAAGDKVYENSITQHTYEVRKGKVIAVDLVSTLPDDFVFAPSSAKLADKILAITQPVYEPKSNHPAQLITRVFEIGDWNMTTATGGDEKDVSIAPYSVKKIRSMKVIIRDDSDIGYYDFFVGGDVLKGDGANTIRCISKQPGFFDSALFDSLSYNRGWVTVEFTP